MATTIVTKSGSGAPAASDLVAGELAVDLTNKRLYTEDSSAAIIELGTNPSGNVTFGDNGKAIFGAGSDLQIYHDGSNSIIHDNGTGDLILKANSFKLWNNTASEALIVADVDGAVKLYHDGSQKLATTSTGIDVTGSVTADGLTVNGGTLDTVATFQSSDQFTDLELTDSGGTSYIRQSNGSLILEADRANASASSIALIKVDGAQVARFASGGDVSFYEDTGTTPKLVWDASAEMLTTSGLTLENSTAPVLKLANSSGSISAGGDLGLIEFYSDDDSGGGNAVKATMSTVQPAASPVSGEVVFKTSESTGSLTERLRVKASGIDVTGSVTADGLTVNSGTANNVATFTSTDAYALIKFEDNDTTTETALGALDDDMVFRVGAAERIRIEGATGNVGIGTSSPATTLDVSASTTRAAYLRSSATGSRLHFLDATTASVTTVGLGAEGNNMALYSGGAETMRLDSNGRVGIGMIANSGCLLNVNDNIRAENSAFLAGRESAALPAFAFHDDTDTGMFNVASDILAFSTAGTERMRIGADGAVQIGTIEPQSPAALNLRNNGANIEFGHTNTTSGYFGTLGTSANNGRPYLGFSAHADAGSVNTFTTHGFKGNVIQGDNSGNLGFHQLTNADASGQSLTTRMTLDTSGNLLVGKTASSVSTDGVELTSTGFTRATVNGDTVLQLNRRTSDGTIINFRKDGTTVGSIGSNGGALYISSPYGTDSGIRFASSLIAPSTTTGANRDAAIDLGYSSSRFKDLHLSGRAYINDGIKIDSGSGIYFGQDGNAANKLDDYEEGTWTVTSGVGLTITEAVYTKVGRVVHLVADITFASGSSSSADAALALPFSNLTVYSSGSLNYTTHSGAPAINVEGDFLKFRASVGGSALAYNNVGGHRFIFHATYFAA